MIVLVGTRDLEKEADFRVKGWITHCELCIDKESPKLSRHLLTQANDFNYLYLSQVFTEREK